VPQTWIKPYDDLVSRLGLNWLHMMYQWGLPCWYALPWAYLGKGGPNAAGYPVAGNIPSLKLLCKAGFTSELMYNVRCEDGHFGESIDTNNAGKCGPAYGVTWGPNVEMHDPPQYLDTNPSVMKGGVCCGDRENNQGNCKGERAELIRAEGGL